MRLIGNLVYVYEVLRDLVVWKPVRFTIAIGDKRTRLEGYLVGVFFFFSSRRRHTRSLRDWSSDVCSSDLEALGQQRGQVGGDELGELRGIRERRVRGAIVGADAREQPLEPVVAALGALEVDELRDVGGEVPLVLEARHVLAGRDPAVLLAIDADEDVALLEVRAVER